MDKHRILILRNDMDINKVMLLGRVGKDPEFFKKNNGEEIGKIRLATSKYTFNKDTQEYTPKTEWHNIVVYSQMLIKIVRERVKKGTKIYVEGTIKSTEFTAKDGTKQKSIDIEIPNFEGTLKIAEQPKTQNVIPEQIQSQGIEEDEFFIDDELPF